MPDAPTPSEILEDLDDDNDDECVYLDRTEPAYIWAHPEDDDRYILLEQSRSGSWLPRGRPIDADEAEYQIGRALESDTDTVEVRPQTTLPPGRHRRDTK